MEHTLRENIQKFPEEYCSSFLQEQFDTIGKDNDSIVAKPKISKFHSEEENDTNSVSRFDQLLQSTNDITKISTNLEQEKHLLMSELPKSDLLSADLFSNILHSTFLNSSATKQVLNSTSDLEPFCSQIYPQVNILDSSSRSSSLLQTAYQKPSDSQFYKVKWKNFMARLTSYVSSLQNNICSSDVVITSKDSQRFFAHKIVLASCSNYLKELLMMSPSDQTVTILLIKPSHVIKALIAYCYTGCVYVSKEQFNDVLETANELGIKGVHYLKRNGNFDGYEMKIEKSTILKQEIDSETDNIKRVKRLKIGINEDDKLPSTSIKEKEPNMASNQNSVSMVENDRLLASLRCQETNGIRVLLWEFLLELLHNDKFAYYIRWLDKSEGIFRILDSEKIAQLWGCARKNNNMTYEKMSRGMRTYYKRGILSHWDGTKLVYKFNLQDSKVKNQLRFYDLLYDNPNSA